MTFAANVASDMAAVVGGEATTSATYTPFGGAGVAVSILFFEEQSEIESGRGPRIYTRRARAYVLKTDVASPTLKDRITVAGEVWNVRSWLSSLGWWRMECLLTSRVDRSGAAIVE